MRFAQAATSYFDSVRNLFLAPALQMIQNLTSIQYLFIFALSLHQHHQQFLKVRGVLVSLASFYWSSNNSFPRGADNYRIRTECGYYPFFLNLYNCICFYINYILAIHNTFRPSHILIAYFVFIPNNIIPNCLYVLCTFLHCT